LIQRCQVHKARNIVDTPEVSARPGSRQTWELDDAETAEKLLCNLARTLEREPPGVPGRSWRGSTRS
jgi:hypothetical protein